MANSKSLISGFYYTTLCWNWRAPGALVHSREDDFSERSFPPHCVCVGRGVQPWLKRVSCVFYIHLVSKHRNGFVPEARLLFSQSSFQLLPPPPANQQHSACFSHLFPITWLPLWTFSVIQVKVAAGRLPSLLEVVKYSWSSWEWMK